MEIKTILVVDDEKEIQYVLKTMLQKEGYMVYTAGTVCEAEQLLKFGSFDIILTDIILPVETGHALKRRYSIPVVTMSAADHTVDVKKPFNKNQLLTALKLTLSKVPLPLVVD